MLSFFLAKIILGRILLTGNFTGRLFSSNCYRIYEYKNTKIVPYLNKTSILKQKIFLWHKRLLAKNLFKIKTTSTHILQHTHSLTEASYESKMVKSGKLTKNIVICCHDVSTRFFTMTYLFFCVVLSIVVANSIRSSASCTYDRFE